MVWCIATALETRLPFHKCLLPHTHFRHRKAWTRSWKQSIRRHCPTNYLSTVSSHHQRAPIVHPATIHPHPDLIQLRDMHALICPLLLVESVSLPLVCITLKKTCTICLTSSGTRRSRMSPAAKWSGRLAVASFRSGPVGRYCTL